METVQHHVNTLTGKDRSREIGDSDDEEDSFTYILTEGNVLKVSKLEFLDFSTIYKRSQKPLHHPAKQEPDSSHKSEAGVEVPIYTQIQIFCAFQAEHVRFHPKDALHLPKYIDLIMKM